MTNEKDFIIGDYDLIKPEFITTVQQCHKEIQKAYEASIELEQYRIALAHKIAELTKQKIYKQRWEYNKVVYEDYYVGKDIKNIDVYDSICDDLIDHGDGYPCGCELVKDYTHE